MTLATPDGTAAYAQRHDSADGYFRTAPGLGLTVSSLGMGSYIGDVGEAANAAYEEAAHVALTGGVNLLDTAVNYREMQSERDLGRGLRRFLDGEGSREEVVVATKGGFLHGDAETGEEYTAYVGKHYIRPGIVDPDDIVNGVHCIHPDYLESELERSLDNLGLDAVDLYMVHNPETQLEAGVEPDTFRDRLRAAFRRLEEEVDEGRIGAYGVATWQGLRLPQSEAGHLPLEQVVEQARRARDDVDGDAEGHHLACVELPVNLALVEAVTNRTQRWQGEDVPALVALAKADLTVLASASLMQARILGHIKDEVRKVLEAGDDDVTACIEFARSAPGVTTALVGMGDPEHAAENQKRMRERSPAPDRVRALMGVD